MKKLIPILFVTVLLRGCVGGEQYFYSGKSQSWSMTYKVIEAQSGSQQVNGTLEYIGAGTAPETIGYSMNSVIRGQSTTNVPVTDDGKVTVQNGSCVDCAIIQEHTKIKVEVIWDGKSETFNLDEES